MREDLDEVPDVSLEELQEFLDADLVDVPSDPVFKERLREQLWTLLAARVATRKLILWDEDGD